MGQMKDIPDSTKTAIVTLRNEGLSQQMIAEKVNCSQGTVSKFLKYYSENQNFKNNRANSGRKRITTLRQDRKLKRIVTKNRFRSLRFISRKWREQGVDASTSTTLRRVHELDFQSRVPKTKPLLTCKQKRARLRWCKDRLQWGSQDWNNVLYSDESMFCVSHGHQGIRVWRCKEEAFKRECLKRSVKLNTSVMIWGCMSAEGLGKLCILTGRVNSEVYMEVLEHFMLPSSEFEDDFIFQQDSASCHTSKRTIAWLKENEIKLLPWPSNSPDLNPIENIWGIMKKRLQDVAPKDKNELVKSVKSVWANQQRSMPNISK